MKALILAAAFAMPFASQQALAGHNPSTPAATVSSEVVEHGGGCRKDSPPGKCCHAGSKPYHCH